MLTYSFISLLWLANLQANLAFGHAQVEQFMRDRPEVRPLLLTQTALRNKLEWGFAGMETGFRVHWENDTPEVRWACYSPRRDGATAHVRIMNGEYATGADKCVFLLVELENAKNESQLNLCSRMAYCGQLNRKDYARSMTRLEFESMLRAREFFKQHPLPPSEASRSYKLLAKLPTNFSDYLDSISSKKSEYVNLIESWSLDYDDLMSRPTLRKP